jgi:hypothetical protein
LRIPMAEKLVAPDRRRRNRLSIKVPVQVRGRGPDGATWEEIASSLDASEGGLALVMSRPVGAGQVLHLSVPLPTRFRQYDLNASSYRVYGLVRDSRPLDARSRVGVMFLGQSPPRGSDPLPSELYRLPSDRERGVGDVATPPATSLLLRLEATEAPGGLAQEEEATVERLTATTAVVTVKRLPVGRGTVLTIQEVAGSFRIRAEVTIISIADNGLARLVLAVLDGFIPERMLGDGLSSTQH